MPRGHRTKELGRRPQRSCKPVGADLLAGARSLCYLIVQYRSQSHVASLPPLHRSDGSDTTTTDSRSRRNRASRRGGQLQTRTHSSTYETWHAPKHETSRTARPPAMAHYRVYPTTTP